MGRRSDHTRDELHAMAVAEARTIVVDEGWGKLNARAVAKRMGYSVGTLYNLFENFDGLVLRLNCATLAALEAELSGVPFDGVPEDDIRRLLRAYLGFVEANTGLWAALFEHRLPSDQVLPDWYQAQVDRVLAILEAALAPLFGPGREPDRRRSARVLWSSLHGIWSLAGARKLDTVTDDTVESLAEDLIDAYVSGIRSKA